MRNLTIDRPILCIVGTRPEAIKLAPVVHALIARGVPVSLCTTGQHRDLARTALADFDLAPDLDLGLMPSGGSPEGFVAAAWPKIGEVIARVRPAMVVVQGDTASALAGALAAAYARVPLGHVEAGLRSGSADPFPEDLNRRLIAQAADRHFAPTPGARAALLAEGIADAAIELTGNPVIDALQRTRGRLAADAGLRAATASRLPPRRPDRPLLVVTAHRRENHGRMPAIAAAIATLARSRDIDVVVPLHPHPAAGPALGAGLGGLANLATVAPLDYLAFVMLLSEARLVMTDSGGVQEEAPAFGCPVLVLRETTERPEGVDAGIAQLVGTDPATIVAAAHRLLDNDAAHAAMATAVLPYGDGRAGIRIAASLERLAA